MLDRLGRGMAEQEPDLLQTAAAFQTHLGTGLTKVMSASGQRMLNPVVQTTKAQEFTLTRALKSIIEGAAVEDGRCCMGTTVEARSP